MSDFSVELFMKHLPEPILEDERLRQLAEVAATCLEKCFKDTKNAAIYCRIDELPEGVLDILAADLKVDWYDYGARLEEKRRTIRDSWYVHKRKGSVAAVERALSDVWPDSIVEEWFDYGGDPYHFRIVLEAADDENPIYPEKAVERVRMFKPARSAMDEDQAIIKTTFGFLIGTHSENLKYHVDVCGTLPGRKEMWRDWQDKGPSVDTSSFSSTYSPRPCGTSLNSLM